MSQRPAAVRAATLIGALTLLVGSSAGCEGVAEVVDPGPDPGPTARALAEGLAAGDLGEVPLLGDAAAAQGAYDAVVADLDEQRPEVGVLDVDDLDGSSDAARGDGAALVTLGWSWVLGAGATWSYTTTAPLVLAGETWRVDLSRRTLAPDLTEDETLQVAPVAARRGPVLGAGGAPLVVPRPVTRIGIDRTQVPARRAGASARALARLAGVAPGPFVARVRAAGDRAFVEAVVLRIEDVTPALVDGAESVRGARLIGERRPLAPSREFAAPLLGAVGPVSAEMVQDDPQRYQAGDVAGLSGLQARYDDRLRGTDGVVVSARSADGTTRRLFRARPEAGSALRLSLDLRLQRLAEQALADTVAPEAGGSALVAVRPSDGSIRAAASGAGAEGLNLATFAQVAPGSTFKMASSLALLRSGLGPGSTVRCPPSVVVDGKRFENYDGYPADALGPVPLRTAVARSCNTAFISARGRLDPGDLAGAAASLGVGIDHDLGFPAYLGQVEAPTSATQAAADLIGQGRVLASPMVMAAAIASVQQGATVLPHLVEGEAAPEVATQDADPLTEEESAALRSMLRAVVTEGSGSSLRSLPGPDVIAKTGTAEFEDGGALLTHAWMVAAQGDLAVAVYLERGDSGSGAAGPVLERFLRGAGR